MVKGPDWRGEQITIWPWVERGIGSLLMSRSPLGKPRYGRMAHGVAPRNINQRLAPSPPR